MNMTKYGSTEHLSCGTPHEDTAVCAECQDLFHVDMLDADEDGEILCGHCALAEIAAPQGRYT